jgi:ABC-type nitrate/sulfonate/bicarbonate transport system substrate-binding protein
MALHDPFDANTSIAKCNCGQHASQAQHDIASAAGDSDVFNSRVVRTAVMKGLFPHDGERRNFLSAVGASTAWAAISSLIPFGALEAMAQEKGPLEKKDLKIGFLPITCATPIIFAGAADFYGKEGLNVSLQKTAGWAIVRDKVLAKEFDASHMLSPMPLAITMGAGSSAVPMVMPVMENINGNAITLAMRHKNNRDPKNWKGMKFAIPFDYSMHNFLLRHYLAEHGLDPDKDVQLRVMAPPDMVANLKSDNIDGFIVAEPFNQRAVYENIGFIHALTSEIWDNHPCCAMREHACSKEIRCHPSTTPSGCRAQRKVPRRPRGCRRLDRLGGDLLADPLRRAGSHGPGKGALEKKDLKVGFIPITCASPLIMADPLGFYKKQGLNVSVIKTAGWALIRDKVLNKEYDASHMLAPMPMAISMGVGSNPIADQRATIQNINGQAITLPSSTRTSATRRTGRASSSPCPSSTRCTTTCCATTSPSTASTRTPTCRCAWCRRPRWWPTCAPATSTASSAPTR